MKRVSASSNLIGLCNQTDLWQAELNGAAEDMLAEAPYNADGLANTLQNIVRPDFTEGLVPGPLDEAAVAWYAAGTTLVLQELNSAHSRQGGNTSGQHVQLQTHSDAHVCNDLHKTENVARNSLRMRKLCQLRFDPELRLVIKGRRECGQGELPTGWRKDPLAAFCPNVTEFGNAYTDAEESHRRENELSCSTCASYSDFPPDHRTIHEVFTEVGKAIA